MDTFGAIISLELAIANPCRSAILLKQKEEGPGEPGAAGAHRLRLRRDGGCVHLEPADPRHGAVRRSGKLGLSAGGNRLLGRDPLSAGAGPSAPPSPPEETAGGGPRTRLGRSTMMALDVALS